MASDAHEDPAFQAMCREHEIEGTAMVALCGAFWNRALASTTGEADPVAEVIECPKMGQQTVREIDGRWKFLPYGTKLYATPPAATPAAPGEGVTEFNVGRWCLSEDDCIAGGIDFSAYERGVSDAATAFSRNTSKAATSHPTEPTSNAFDVAARLVRELQDETAARDKEAWMREASATLQRLAHPAPVAAPATREAIEAACFRWLLENRISEDGNGWLQITYGTARQGEHHPEEARAHWLTTDIAGEMGLEVGDPLAAPAPASEALTPPST